VALIVASLPSQMKLIDAHQSDHPDDDQVEGDDIVQQSGHDEDQDPGDQDHQRPNAYSDAHPHMPRASGTAALHPGATAARDEEDHCEDDADDEKNPRDIRGNAGDSSEAEHRSDERDHQKYCSPIKHIAS